MAAVCMGEVKPPYVDILDLSQGSLKRRLQLQCTSAELVSCVTCLPGCDRFATGALNPKLSARPGVPSSPGRHQTAAPSVCGPQGQPHMSAQIQCTCLQCHLWRGIACCFRLTGLTSILTMLQASYMQMTRGQSPSMISTPSAVALRTPWLL